MFVTIKKPSAWVFDTSASGGVGLGYAMAEGGAIFLKDPKGKAVTFYYGAPGVGLSAGFKLPKIGKLNLDTVTKIGNKSPSGMFAPAAAPNKGQMFVLTGLPGDELTADDIRGLCIFCEAGGGSIACVSATVMLVGVNPVWFAAMAAAPLLTTFLIPNSMLTSAKGLLVMGGFYLSPSASVGIGEFLGLLE